MCEDFVPNFGDKKTGLLRHDNAPSHTSFSLGNFLPKTAWLSPPPRTLFFVSPIEDKLKGHHFDIIVVIDAESQMMLNTLTEHDF
jgi:hypothetical protein